MQFVKPDHVLKCVLCNHFFLTQQALFSHLNSFHANQTDAALSLSMRQSSVSFSRSNPNSNPNYCPITTFRNHHHNQISRFQNTVYPATTAVETPNFQLMPMASNNNTNFIIGQPQFELRPPQPQPQLQPSQPQPQFQPPQFQPQPQSQLQPPQPEPHVQLQIVDVEMSLEDEIRTLPLIEQLEREWPEITLMEDNREDFMDLNLRL